METQHKENCENMETQLKEKNQFPQDYHGSLIFKLRLDQLG